MIIMELLGFQGRSGETAQVAAVKPQTHQGSSYGRLAVTLGLGNMQPIVMTHMSPSSSGSSCPNFGQIRLALSSIVSLGNWGIRLGVRPLQA